MAATANTNSGGMATFSVLAGGNRIPDEIRILSINIQKEVNNISTATLVILDGEADTGKFDASSSSVFIPGVTISIEAGYDSTNRSVFTGIITAQRLRIDGIMGSVLEVCCHDQAVRMTVSRKSMTFSNKTGSDVMYYLIRQNNLQANVSTTKEAAYDHVQYNTTDWDFLQALAAANGLITTALDGTVSAFSPTANTTSVLTALYGSDLMEFDAKLDAVSQLGSVTSNAWDYKQQQLTEVREYMNIDGPGNLSSVTLAGVLHQEPFRQQTPAPLSSDVLSGLSASTLLRSAFAKITGTAKFRGTGIINPGNYMTFGGLGDRFNGDYLVSGVVHDISDGNWYTQVSLGLPEQQPQPAQPVMPGITNTAKGLFNATVKQISYDPEFQYRILVSSALFDRVDGNDQGVWARLSNFYATANAGAFFIPEVGDEVILGFLDEDPRYPVILGSLYSDNKHTPPFNTNERNDMKAIVTQSGLSVQFDDGNKALTITTPNRNRIVFSDRDRSVTINDENNNRIVLSGGGIEIRSAGDVDINAGGDVKVQGRSI